MHRAWMAALTKEAVEPGTAAAFDVFLATRPALPAGAATPFPSLRRSAWDAAVSSGPLGAAATFDPANRKPSVRLLWLTLADIESAETLLLAGYRQHVPVLRGAAGRDR